MNKLVNALVVITFLHPVQDKFAQRVILHVKNAPEELKPTVNHVLIMLLINQTLKKKFVLVMLGIMHCIHNQF